MKRSILAVVSAVVAASLCVTAAAVEAPEKVNTYTSGQFADVPAGLWCAANVRYVYEYGIMNGKTAQYFDTTSNLTVAQAVVMACRLHSAYVGDGAEFPAGDPWYQPYLRYASENDILWEADRYDVAITRADFAMLFDSALPVDALPVLSSIETGAIPDVPLGSYCARSVYRLYEAGILQGNDATGRFTPYQPITRGAAAAIASRMADPSLRKAITLQRAPAKLVPIDALQNRAKLKKKCTEAEFQAAYDAAKEVVTPLAGLPREDQLYGIATALRQMVESGAVAYTTSAAHYNDPYGYLVTGVSSCAGCARTTGLCLSMLGIPFEHVNEDQWSHQWCRAKMPDGTYWICDAYGLYCGPERSPYQHPYF
ncbi:MAG: S-layer homology domain-containing protein [Eubacteriales bacterium]|nr:S-layer homology domain-containing protein [Eubacteriales bacterium]